MGRRVSRPLGVNLALTEEEREFLLSKVRSREAGHLSQTMAHTVAPPDPTRQGCKYQDTMNGTRCGRPVPPYESRCELHPHPNHTGGVGGCSLMI